MAEDDELTLTPILVVDFSPSLVVMVLMIVSSLRMPVTRPLGTL